MQETDLHKPSHPQYQQDGAPIEPEPDWRESLSRAVRRNCVDREREIFHDWERQHHPPHNPAAKVIQMSRHDTL
jgi:hypothetical protein